MKIGTHGRLAAAGEGYDSDLGRTAFVFPAANGSESVLHARWLDALPYWCRRTNRQFDAATERSFAIFLSINARWSHGRHRHPQSSILAIADRVILLKQDIWSAADRHTIPQFKLGC